MHDMTRIVILGGGYGGVHAAKLLHKRFKREKQVQITLIDRNPYHTLMTELHEIAGSRTEPEAVQVSFKRIFSSSSVQVVVDEIDSIDFENNRLKSSSSEYEYDYLILGTGGHPEFFGTPGVQENSFTLWSLEDAIRIREHVEIRFREAAKEPDTAKRKVLLTFAIAGAGFTGIELAGEVMERADTLCRKYHIDRTEVRIMVIEAKDSILPTLAKGPQQKAMKYLQKKGVEILLNAPIVRAENESIRLKDETEIKAGTFIWTCGIQASEFTARIALTKGRVSNDQCSVATPEGIHGMAGCHFDEDERYIVGERGRILVNEYMQSVDFKNVYLCGDMIWYLHEEKVIPQIVETALQSGETAAHNIVCEIEKKQRKTFSPAYHGFMVSIGGRYGVAHVMGLSLYGFMAMAMKHFINLHYLWSIAGLNACWGYLQEEFLSMKENRSIIGGHAAAKVPGYWVLPVRLWLGLVWFFEGLNKIGEGWFNFSKGTRSSWMFSKGVIQAGMGPTEPTAAEATQGLGAGDAAKAAWDNVGGITGTVTQDGAGTDATSAASAIETVETIDATPEAVDVIAASSEVAEGAEAGLSVSPNGTTAISDWDVSSTADTAAQSTDTVSAASAATDAVSQAADATSAATALGDTAQVVATSTDTWKLDLESTILPYDSPIVTWFRQTFMDGMAAYIHYQLFQVAIVSVEMIIGLAILGGLFTWGAALVSIGMCLVFTLSGMFSWTQLWFVFAALVMMGGAGRILGLDYWVMPWLQKQWNSTRLAQRTHLYINEPIIRRKKT